MTLTPPLNDELRLLLFLFKSCHGQAEPSEVVFGRHRVHHLPGLPSFWLKATFLSVYVCLTWVLFFWVRSSWTRDLLGSARILLPMGGNKESGVLPMLLLKKILLTKYINQMKKKNELEGGIREKDGAIQGSDQRHNKPSGWIWTAVENRTERLTAVVEEGFTKQRRRDVKKY